MWNTYFAHGGQAEVKLVLKITVDSSVLAFVLYLVTVTKSEEGMFKQHTGGKAIFIERAHSC